MRLPAICYEELGGYMGPFTVGTIHIGRDWDKWFPILDREGNHVCLVPTYNLAIDMCQCLNETTLSEDKMKPSDNLTDQEQEILDLMNLLRFRIEAAHDNPLSKVAKRDMALTCKALAGKLMDHAWHP